MTRKYIIIIMFLLGMELFILEFSSCSSTQPEVEDIEIKDDVSDESLEKEEAPADYRYIDLSMELFTCNEKVNEASRNLFKSVLSQTIDGENVFFSPLSVNYVIASLLNGANGETRDEILKYFKIDNSEEINELFKILNTELPTLDNKVTFNLSNSLWVDQSLTVHPSYMDFVENGWPMELFSAEFGTNSIMEAINSWVERSTKGLITKFLQQPPEGYMAILNAVWFKGKWQISFDKESTKLETFRGTSGCSTVEMMHGEKTGLNYIYGNNWQGVILPYGNGNFEMCLILPEEDINPNELSLSEDSFMKRETCRVKLSMPKFECFYRNKKFEEALKEVGIIKMFSPDCQDLDKLILGGNDDINIAQFIHEAVITVNEEGVEAAGVSGVFNFISTGDEPAIKKEIDLVFDRPFLYEIRETSTNTVIFMGVVNNL